MTSKDAALGITIAILCVIILLQALLICQERAAYAYEQVTYEKMLKARDLKLSAWTIIYFKMMKKTGEMSEPVRSDGMDTGHLFPDLKDYKMPEQETNESPITKA